MQTGHALFVPDQRGRPVLADVEGKGPAPRRKRPGPRPKTKAEARERRNLAWLAMRQAGMTIAEIADATGFARSTICVQTAEVRADAIAALARMRDR